MASASTTQVLAATRQWLKPVIYILIRCGVTWRDFSELAKTTFVEVATGQFGKRGRPTNVSRTAVLTGLARRDVRKHREKLEVAPEAPTSHVTKAAQVLTAWHLDKRFLDDKGKPLALPLEGNGATFAALVRACGGGDVPLSTLLRELRSAGAIHEREEGRWEPLMRNYLLHTIDEHVIRLWGTRMADIASTYVHNFTRTSRAPARFERAAVNDRIARSALPEFRKFLDEEGQAFLERLDAWLTAHEVKDGTREEPATIRLGAGLYHIQD
ncbi:MAG: DUF6502 family protein [Gammaproteobacteria bacterium]